MALRESSQNESKGSVLLTRIPKKKTVSPESSAKKCCGTEMAKAGTAVTQQHPDHQGQLMALRRVRGQIGGLEKMIEERRYCVDVLTQLKAAYSSLRTIESSILETHLRMCVKGAIESKNAKESEIKIGELVKLLATR